VRFKKMHSVAKIAQSSESPASQPTRPTATDLDRRTRRGLPSANELNPQAVPVGCLFRNMKQPVPNILSPSSPSFVVATVETHRRGSTSTFSAPSLGVIEEHGTPRHHAGPAMAQAACPHRGPTTGGSGHARSRVAVAPEYRPAGPLARHAVAFGPRPGTPRENFCGFIDPEGMHFLPGSATFWPWCGDRLCAAEGGLPYGGGCHGQSPE
jgi:hypothetical protein